MQTETGAVRKLLSQDLMDLVIRVGIVALLVVMCVRVFTPFAGIMTWAVILAVAIYPVHRKIAARMGGRQGRAATAFVLGVLLLIGAPTVILGASSGGHIHDVATAVEEGRLNIPQLSASVAGWPVVGKKLHAAWTAAADNLPEFLQDNAAQVRKITRSLLAGAASTLGGAFMFLGAFIIAGIMMAYGEPGSAAMRRIFERIAGPGRGGKLQGLSVATVRSVAMGVIGVAFIQALLLGVGFLLAGVPGAGLLALVVLFIGILQLPALLISLPVIGWLWWSGDGSTVHDVVFTVYLLVAGAADNVLKPILLGRGVDVPMPVVLIGALGGMVTGGFIGLFVGAVILSVGYELFMQWVDTGLAESAPESSADAAAPPADGATADG